MDRAKRARKPVRSRVTKTCKEIEVEIATRVPLKETLENLVKKLSAAEEELKVKDAAVMDALLDENKSDQEIETEDEEAEAYRDQIRMTKERVTYVVTPQVFISPSSSSPPGPPNQNNKTFRLPKIELPKFNGELKSWLGWWSQFEKIDKDTGLHESDKFQYLIQATEEKSKPREMISTYPPTGENYRDAIESLKEHYGREGLQLQVYLRELLSLVITNVTKKEKVPLDKLYLQLVSYLRALNTLDLSKTEPSMFFYPLVESSLPEDVLRTWLRGQTVDGNGDKKGKLENLMEFLKKEVESEQQIHLAKNTFEEQKGKQNRFKNVREEAPTAASLLNNMQVSDCIFCGKSNHNSKDCYRANKMTIEVRLEIKIREARCCFVCLKKGHLASDCKTRVRCVVCTRQHLAIMCPGESKDNKSSRETPQSSDNGSKTEVESSSINYNQTQKTHQILMKTLQVQIRGPTGRAAEVRLLFDEGSQRSYVKNSLAQDMQCAVMEQVRLQNALFGGHMTEIKTSNKYKVSVEGLYDNKRRNLELVGEDVICTTCPTIPEGPWMKTLSDKNIRLSDTYAPNPEIQVLIGSDLWGSLMTGRMIKLEGGLIAVESIFGWTLSGKVPVQSSANLNIASVTLAMFNREEKSLPDLWKLEVIGIRDTAEKISQEEHEADVKKQFQENISSDKKGRYVVTLPWIPNPPFIPTNRVVAEKRLLSSTEKLIKREEYESYDKIFSEWEKEGIIQEVPEEEGHTQHYLPHRPVFKPESLTTPVRPVFDASCKDRNNPSLNQCLEKGPNMLELIPSILLRFRAKRIGILSDIRKAFQMVGVTEEDRNYQKFLWWRNYEEKKMKVYRHYRVVFGMNCSPFILAAVLDYHLSRVPEEDKPAAEVLKKSLYVDNCVESMDTVEEYLEFRRKSTDILLRASMELRQWESNSEEPPGSLETSVLGIKWDKNEDVLYCEIPKDFKEDSPTTKRSVLSLVSQIYDPIGVTCPAILQPKLMLQDSWALDLSWDTVWEEGRESKFKDWCSDLGALQEIRIPRWSSPPGVVQLHTFCDASQSAYAAVVFVRVQTEEKASVQLLQAKSRLSPLDKKKQKKVTINRLELLGCLIGSRLTSSVKEALSLDKVKTFLWSDSTNALAWIRRDEDWGTFVGNRVREINKLTKAEDWRHVPGPLNPADLPSRGCSPSQLLESRWWEGPSWLKEPEEDWPVTDMVVDEDAVCEERRKVTTTASSIIQTVDPRFSTYLKNVCVAAWIRRFVENCRTKKEDRSCNPFPTAKEMRRGERDLLFQIQRTHFPKEPVLKGMEIILQEDKLFHVKTRLIYKDDTELFRSPILLPKDDPMVHQLIIYIHRTNCHAGTQFVLGKLRERYWIPSGRKTVGRIIKKCVTCRRHTAKRQSSEPAPLPQARIETQGAFQTTGVDLAGPIVLKKGKKVWIVLYTCAVYRGVYLDIVDSLSTAEFMDSLEKFTNSIGRPSHLFSDNGTNFVGAQNLMKTLNWKKLEEKLHVTQMNWTFNPPAAPWWGGWWERLIGTMKGLLKRMLGTAKLTRKELEKCLAAVSCTINNRPLTTLTEDGDDLIPLTPNMFMKDIPVSGLPEWDLITGRDLQENYQKTLNLKKKLKERFRKEYLAQLVQMKSETKGPPLEVEDVVLVGSDDKKRYAWPLGKILELVPGTDGKIRIAKVKTAHSILTRPIQRLYPLEVSSPKLFPIPVKSQEITNNVPEEEEAMYVTRSGRVVKKPSHYGKWC